MMLYKNMKVMFHSLDGDTAFCDMFTGVFQGNTLVPHLLMICLDYVLRTSRNLKDFAKTMTVADYADDLAILINTPAQAECLLYGLGQAVRGIGLYVNRNKTEFMYFK